MQIYAHSASLGNTSLNGSRAVTSDGMPDIRPADTIHISAVQFGKTILDGVTVTGCRCESDILAAAQSLLAHLEGIVKVSFRNRDSGWRVCRSIRVRRPSMSMLAMA